MRMARQSRGKIGEVQAIDSSELREFRKTNEAIGLRVVEGNLSLLSRKVFNVMMYHAQEMKVPGLNSPINTPASKKYFWIPLSDLARDAAYDSKDVQYLKKQLEEMQNIKLLMENERQWTSERLVSSVTLVNPAGLNKHSGQVWFGFAFPPEVHEQVMAPSTYTRLSIVYQSSLKSGSALALYEICRRYATNPSKVTFIQTYEHWYGVITGNSISDSTPPVYKYFKRDTIKPAIAEINALTDISIELIEHKNGRRVEKLQFRVEQTKQAQLEFPAPPIIDMELMGKVMKFGFSQADASDLVAQHSDDILRAAISRVEARAESKGMTPLETPAGYFRWALQDLVRNPAAAPALVAPKSVGATASTKASGRSVMERFLAARAQEALGVYKELDEHERKTLFDVFKAQNTNKTVKLDKGLDSAAVRGIFAPWYAKYLWGEPTAQSLAQFIEEYGAAR
ncbi:initiator RepB protein [Acidovorax delafieldii 2AN]|jgi:hypothetical protein|uniref:Initiator RepB protein n=2 Tax=Acidovorax delafieldii TaxID=47920 RepID=C5SZF3_ACIDE|nr:initiator RepB protein [Acidovorax delafieldii 2AN]